MDLTLPRHITPILSRTHGRVRFTNSMPKAGSGDQHGLTTHYTGWRCDIISAGHIDGADDPCPSNWLACLDGAKNSKTDKKLQATILHLKCQTGSYIWHQSISNLKFPFCLSTKVVSLEQILLDCSEIHRFLLYASGSITIKAYMVI